MGGYRRESGSVQDSASGSTYSSGVEVSCEHDGVVRETDRLAARAGLQDTGHTVGYHLWRMGKDGLLWSSFTTAQDAGGGAGTHSGGL